MNKQKQKMQKLIDDVKVASNSSVALFTSDELHIKMLKDWFPGIKVYLISKDCLPDSDKCYIIPEFNPLKEIKLYEENNNETK